MPDWLRSLSVLGGAFVVLVVVTIGLAAFIVPEAAGSGGALLTPSPGASVTPGGPPSGPVTAIGGTLTVSGDREGALTLDRELFTDQGIYSLDGEQGAVYFGGTPFEVDRISYDGLELYVDPGQCTLTPGERHDPTGVAGAQISCTDLSDIRDGGTVSVEGTVGVSADLLGMRGEMPPTGGTLRMGDEDLVFNFVSIVLEPSGFAPGGGFLITEDDRVIIRIDYDPMTHALGLLYIEIEGEGSDIPSGACTITTVDIGVLNPRTTTAEVTIDCPSVELASGETVSISGTLIADMIEQPD